MTKNSFHFVKYMFVFGMIAVYFLVVHCIMEQSGVLSGVFSVKMPAGRCNLVLSSVYCCIYILLLHSFEAVAVGHRRILDLSYGHFITSCCMNIGFSIFLWSMGSVGIGYVAKVFFGIVFFQCICGLLLILFLHRIYERHHFVKEALFIYGDRDNLNEYRRMKSTITRYFKVSQELSFKAGREQVLQAVNRADILFLGDIPTQLRNEVIKFCMQSQKECYCVPKISDVYIQNAAVRQLNDKLLLQFPNIGICGYAWLVKRVMDIVVSAVLLILAVPFMGIILIGIKLEDGGSILYRQERVTEGNRTFWMLKFRSMKENAEKDGMTLAKKEDSRVTRVGRVIRNLHMDELPQLINVIKGDMSLVGPRPERKEFIQEYEKIIPEFSERLKVKGGLTGYAQVYGKYNTEPEDKIKYDLYYIYNYSVWLDVKILLLTVRILFQPENTQGVEQGQTSAIKKK